MTEKEHGSVAMGDSRERGAAMATVKDHIAWAVQIMQRGARMRLDGIPDDPTFLSSSFGPDVTAEIARTLTAALSRPVQEPVAKRWLVEETLQGGSIRWKTYEHEHIARMAASGGNKTLTALYAAPQPAHGTSATERGSSAFEAAWQAFQNCPIDGTADDEENTRSQLKAALAVTAGQGVEVKPLEWFQSGEDYGAGSVVGEYEILKTPEAWTVFRGGQGISRHNNNLEAAKAAAQADYKRRIRSALASPTPKEESK